MLDQNSGCVCNTFKNVADKCWRFWWSAYAMQLDQSYFIAINNS